MPRNNNPLRPIVAQWLHKLRFAWDYKTRTFGQDAKECMAFFNGPYDWLYGPMNTQNMGMVVSYDDIPQPTFRMSVNKVAEMVQLFGPSLYQKNPHRTITPRTLVVPPMPPALQQAQQTLAQSQQNPQMMRQLMANPNMMRQLMQAQQQLSMWQSMSQQDQFRDQENQVRALLLDAYLNYTPNELGLLFEVRQAIDEAIIKGAGCLSGGTEVYAEVNGDVGVWRVRDLYRREPGMLIRLWDGKDWNRVKNMRQLPRTGTELSLKLRSGQEIYCTHDHIWPMKDGIRLADQLKVGDCLQHVRLAEPEHYTNPEHVSDEIGWIVGLYLGDGFFDADCEFRFEICSHINEKESHARVERIVKSYGGTINWKQGGDNGNGWNAMISCPPLAAIVRMYVTRGGWDTKHLTSECWIRNNKFLQAVLDGYCDSDGHWIPGEDIWRLRFGDNKQLANNIRTLCARLGLRLTLTRAQEKRPDGELFWLYRGAIRTREPKNEWSSRDLGEIMEIGPADWRCDYFYDIGVEDDPHTYALASGVLTHNCLWTETYQQPTGMKMVGSFYDSVDNFLMDPDAEKVDDCWWVARRCMHATWAVEKEYGLERGALKGNNESWDSLVAYDPDDYRRWLRAHGGTNDICTYWKVYSRMGAGGRLRNADPSLPRRPRFLRGQLFPGYHGWDRSPP